MFDCRLLAELHNGDRSRVYRACRLSDGSPVILKVPHPARERAERVRALQSELAVFHRLTGLSGTPRTQGLMQEGDMVALMLEDRGGLPLSSLDLAGKVEIAAFFRLALGVVEILKGLHERGVIHGDLTPQHLLIGDTPDQLELVGFSRSLLTERVFGPSDSIPPSEPLAGRSYTSPEQTGRFNRSIDVRTDYYLLGLTLYEVLVGVPAFQSNDPVKLMHSHLARTPPDPRQFREGVSPHLAQILLKLLAKDADDRYQTLEILERDLRHGQKEMAAGASERSSAIPPSVRVGFRLPDCLYGREVEMTHLEQALEQTKLGISRVVGVVGAEGVGKSALLDHCTASVEGSCGLVVRGCFEPSQGPYTAIRRALDGLAGSLVDQSWGIDDWQAELGESSASVLVDFCPALGAVIKNAKNPAQLAPRRAATRLAHALAFFFQVLAKHVKRLCLLFDDLHSAGEDSLRLLKTIAQDNGRSGGLVLFAQRPPEAGAVNPVAELLAAVPSRIQATRLELGELLESDIVALVSDTLHVQGVRADALAQVVMARTRGNPYFVRSFLAALHADGVLQLGASEWNFDLEQVRQRAVTDNVVDLLLHRIQRLPQSARVVLQHAALLGLHFRLDTLKVVANRPVKRGVDAAVTAELLLRLEPQQGPSTMGEDEESEYQFSHDRVRQAVLCTLDDPSKALLHRQIGLRLHAVAPHLSASHSQSIFDVVRHLNQADLSSGTRAERANFSKLNLEAAECALHVGAGALALQLAQAGCSWLDEDSWEIDYCLARDLYQTAAEAAFSWAEHEAFASISDTLLRHSRTALDSAKIRKLQGRVHQAQSKTRQALATYLTGLQELGIELPMRPCEDALSRVRRETATLLSGRTHADLLRLPLTNDPVTAMAMELLSKLVFFAYASADPLLPFVVCKLVTLSVTLGTSAESANGYTFYGQLLAAEGDIDGACQFGELALELAHRHADPQVLSQTYLYTYWELMHWKRSPGELVAKLEKAVDYGLEAGSPLNAACSAATLSICRLWAGDRLPALAHSMAAQRPMMEQFRQTLVLQWHDPLAQFIANLRSTATCSTELCGDLYDENVRLEMNAQVPSALFNFYVWKTLICYLLGDPAEAHATSRKNAPLRATYGHALWAIPVNYVDGLCQLSVAANSTGVARTELIERTRGICKKMDQWQRHNPEAVAPKNVTLRAQMAQLDGDTKKAVELFDAATILADANPALHERGITYQLAGQFCLECGDQVKARERLRASRRAFFQWGALAKARALEESFPHLLPQTLPDTRSISSPDSEAPEFDTIDLLSVLNASRTISSEIKLEPLLSRLMTLLIENGGAELGYLLRKRGENWVTEAGQSCERGTFGLLQSTPIGELASEGLPPVATTIVEHVAVSGQVVLLDDASASSQFARDPHIEQRQVASLLCFPLQRGGETLAIVYLENNLARGAFTSNGRRILEMLTTQAAISLENADLYESLEQKVEERTEQLRSKNEELAGALTRVTEVQEQLVSQGKLAELGALAAGIAHEIKNPLNLVTNFSEVAAGLAGEIEQLVSTTSEPTDSAAVKELKWLLDSFGMATRKIGEHGARAAGIVNGMSLHARSSGGPREMAGLNSLLAQSVTLMASELIKGPLKVELNTDYDTRIGRVEMATQEISRVIVNLITNAVQAVAQKHQQGVQFQPAIAIGSKDLGTNVEVTVQDNGLGMSSSVRERIFIPFFTTKPPGKGTGLGLSISHDIVVRGHRGQLQVDSQEGEFTRFTVVLPKRQLRS